MTGSTHRLRAAARPTTVLFASIPISAVLFGCNLIFGHDDLEIVETSSTASAGGQGTGAQGSGGQGGGAAACGEGLQDRDEDGTCEAACGAETCSGHGMCSDGSGTAVCTCEPRFMGVACASCAVGYAGASCEACAAGFQDKNDDGTCLPECGTASCSGNGLCDDASGEATCTCSPTFTGADCDAACAAGMAGATCEFRIVYGLTIPTTEDWNVQADVPYDIDDAALVGTFDRVAYRLILDAEQVWVEMDPFTANAAQLGVPTEWTWDVAITNVLIRSLSANQPSVTSAATGNVEMWSSCYSAGPGGVYDHDDDISAGSDCYGSLQVHVASSPVLCVNSWANGGNLDIGIGPAPTGNPDWTFADNGASFTTRRLEVYVRE